MPDYDHDTPTEAETHQGAYVLRVDRLRTHDEGHSSLWIVTRARDGAPDRFVTHVYVPRSDSYLHGDYTDDIAEARDAHNAKIDLHEDDAFFRDHS